MQKDLRNTVGLFKYISMPAVSNTYFTVMFPDTAAKSKAESSKQPPGCFHRLDSLPFFLAHRLLSSCAKFHFKLVSGQSHSSGQSYQL